MTNKEIIENLRIIQTKYSEIRKDDNLFIALDEAIYKIGLLDKTIEEAAEWIIKKLHE